MTEAAVERDLFRLQPKPLDRGRGLGQQRVLAGIARRGGSRQDQPTRAWLGRGRQLADLGNVAELGLLAGLALSDWPGVGIGQGDEPIADLLSFGPLEGLGRDAARSGRRAARSRRPRGASPEPRARAPSPALPWPACGLGGPIGAAAPRPGGRARSPARGPRPIADRSCARSGAPACRSPASGRGPPSCSDRSERPGACLGGPVPAPLAGPGSRRRGSGRRLRSRSSRSVPPAAQSAARWLPWRSRPCSARRPSRAPAARSACGSSIRAGPGPRSGSGRSGADAASRRPP